MRKNWARVNKRRYFLCFLIILSACSTPSPSLVKLSSNAVILAFGDSLTYGSGANIKTESYPAILEQLTSRRVINAGIPGEISEDGLKRLSTALLKHKPDLVLLCHGGNDILRRLDKRQLANNLEQMVKIIKASGAEVVIIGVPTFGFGLTVPDLYPDLVEKYRLAGDMTTLVDIESQPNLKSDHIHPNAKGYRIFGQRIFQLLQQAGAV